MGQVSAEHGVVSVIGGKSQTEAGRGDDGPSGGHHVKHTQGAGAEGRERNSRLHA